MTKASKCGEVQLKVIETSEVNPQNFNSCVNLRQNDLAPTDTFLQARELLYQNEMMWSGNRASRAD